MHTSKDLPRNRKWAPALLAVLATMVATMGFSASASATDLHIDNPANGANLSGAPSDYSGEIDDNFVAYVQQVRVLVYKKNADGSIPALSVFRFTQSLTLCFFACNDFSLND